MQFVAYLAFDGNCQEAFRYYEKHLKGKIEAMIPHEGTPAEEHVPADWKKKIMHAKLVAGGGVLMGADAPPGRGGKRQGFSVSIHLEDVNEATRIFDALADGGTTLMPLGETFWAKRFGMCTDRFGTPWMINCGVPA